MPIDTPRRLCSIPLPLKDRGSRTARKGHSPCVPPGTKSSQGIFACDTMAECGTARCSTPIPFPSFLFSFCAVYLSAWTGPDRVLLKLFFGDREIPAGTNILAYENTNDKADATVAGGNERGMIIHVGQLR